MSVKTQKGKKRPTRSHDTVRRARAKRAPNDTQSPAEAVLSQELRELGELLKRAVRIARRQAKVAELESKISRAVDDLGTRVNEITQRAREPLRAVGEQMRHATESYRETGAPEDFARGIAKSVRLVNERIRNAIDEMEQDTTQ